MQHLFGKAAAKVTKKAGRTIARPASRIFNLDQD
jgi:hypothetical protein